jgi:glycerol-3-phosphate dehydrogenase subunit B
LAAAGLPYAPLGEGNRSVLTSMGTIKTTFGVPRSMAAGADALDARSPCLLVDFRGLREFSARQIVATLADHWPGLCHRRIEFPGSGAAAELYAAHLARNLETRAVREQVIGLVKPLVGDAHAVGFPAVLGLARSADVHAAFEAGLGVPVFEIPTMPTSVPGLRLQAALEAAVAMCGVRRISRVDVQTLAFAANDDATLELGDHPNGGRGERVVARAVVLATGRFSGRGLVADRDRIREPLLGLPVTQPPSREDWHRRDFHDPAGHAIHRAGLTVDHAWRPLDGTGAPAWPRLLAVGSILAKQDWIRSKCGSGLAIATAWSAIDHLARDLRATASG